MRWVASDDCETDSRCRRGARRRARRADPRRLRHPRHRGQDRRDPLCAQARPAGARAVPGPAVHRHRGGALGGDRRGQLRGVRSGHARPGDLHDGRSGATPSPGRPTSAAPCGWVPILLCWRRIRLWRRPIGATEVSERHRHRYEVNNDYRDRIAESGLRFSGTSPDGHLVEFVEYAADVHPVPGRHPGASGAEEPADAAASAVRGVHRRGAGIQGRGTACPLEIPEQRANGAEHAADTGAAGPRARRPWLNTTSRPSPPKPLYVGKIFALRADEVADAGRQHARREVVEHYGAVAVVAIDDDANIVLVYQYRHPLGRRLWELPAGLLDVARRGAAPRPRPANSRRRRGSGRRSGACWSTSSPRRVSATRACGSISPPGSPTSAGRDAHDEEADMIGRRVVSLERGGADGVARRDRQLAWRSRAFWPPTQCGPGTAQPRPVDAPWIDRPTRVRDAASSEAGALMTTFRPALETSCRAISTT